ncbi:MAG TPA: hypothetical protein VM733_07465 [Thermoanaerobaculia bacterium]|nr:hypothetical protein [Thermoanaerobaculia bacterium]
MDTFTILFFGFIAHVTIFDGGVPIGERAVFVKPDVQHMPVLLVDEADVDGPHTCQGLCSFELLGHQWVLSGQGVSGPVDRKPSFLAHVTPLSLITDGKPEKKISGKIPSAHWKVLGSLDYKGGCLTTRDVKTQYVVKSKDPRWNRAYRLAHVVQYSVQTAGSVVLTNENGETITLKPNAVAVVSSVSPHGHPHAFADYNWILDGDEIFSPHKTPEQPLTIVAPECASRPLGIDLAPYILRERTPDIECTNSRYP